MDDLRVPTGILFSILGIILLVYSVVNPDKLVSHAGHKVTVDADVKGDSLTVKSVKM